jgi:hypothetical protein
MSILNYLVKNPGKLNMEKNAPFVTLELMNTVFVPVVLVLTSYLLLFLNATITTAGATKYIPMFSIMIPIP